MSFSELPGWAEDRLEAALPAFRASCAVMARLPADRTMGGEGALARTAGDFAPACAAAATLPADPPAARHFFETHFAAYAVGEDVLTGYYEPELRGSTRRDGPYQTPLHATPPELVQVDLGQFAQDLRGRRTAGVVRDGRLQPFADRAAITGGALDGRGLELAWVDDPADAFFLQIQGSGRVRLAEGGVLRLGYAAQNGHPYYAIGRALVENGTLTRETVSMQAIRAWLAEAPPGEAAALMNRNPSYVFFRPLTELPPEAGPLGALGAPLTPGRSLAVDRTRTPLGAPVWLAAQAPLRRLVVAQDTGGAIRGAARADLFTGWGDAAGAEAGGMRDPAALFVLVPRQESPAR
ncbi:murein transglycosylase A [Falsiroseomonas sp.]|uniref:murein transglycosylase A n=1 Tax=Falsiroseomonas sp. TaxID=2870721 RepID=UPI002716A0BA|nr:murein transglycosylase A [Falsiroseomonas sp.]MDO9501335.1 murein transglycosylase A [Falsiroseomonas sp.]